jgi:hypothetical protein
MFPDLDLTDFIQQFGRQMTTEGKRIGPKKHIINSFILGLVALIIDRRAQIPKKRKPNQQQQEDDVDSQADRLEIWHPFFKPYPLSFFSDPCLSDSDELGDFLIDKLLATLNFKVKMELQRQPKNVGIALDRNKRDLLVSPLLSCFIKINVEIFRPINSWGCE